MKLALQNLTTPFIITAVVLYTIVHFKLNCIASYGILNLILKFNGAIAFPCLVFKLWQARDFQLPIVLIFIFLRMAQIHCTDSSWPVCSLRLIPPIKSFALDTIHM